MVAFRPGARTQAQEFQLTFEEVYASEQRKLVDMVTWVDPQGIGRIGGVFVPQEALVPWGAGAYIEPPALGGPTEDGLLMESMEERISMYGSPVVLLGMAPTEVGGARRYDAMFEQQLAAGRMGGARFSWEVRTERELDALTNVVWRERGLRLHRVRSFPSREGGEVSYTATYVRKCLAEDLRCPAGWVRGDQETGDVPMEQTWCEKEVGLECEDLMGEDVLGVEPVQPNQFDFRDMCGANIVGQFPWPPVCADTDLGGEPGKPWTATPIFDASVIVRAGSDTCLAKVRPYCPGG